MEVTFTYPDGKEETKSISEDGIIKFKDVPPGRYSIKAEGYDILIQGED